MLGDRTSLQKGPEIPGLHDHAPVRAGGRLGSEVLSSCSPGHAGSLLGSAAMLTEGHRLLQSHLDSQRILATISRIPFLFLFVLFCFVFSLLLPRLECDGAISAHGDLRPPWFKRFSCLSLLSGWDGGRVPPRPENLFFFSFFIFNIKIKEVPGLCCSSMHSWLL